MSTSGARYSGVPQILLVVDLVEISCLESPKSVRMAKPKESIRTFYGFRLKDDPGLLAIHNVLTVEMLEGEDDVTREEAGGRFIEAFTVLEMEEEFATGTVV